MNKTDYLEEKNLVVNWQTPTKIFIHENCLKKFSVNKKMRKFKNRKSISEIFSMLTKHFKYFFIIGIEYILRLETSFSIISIRSSGCDVR